MPWLYEVVCGLLEAAGASPNGGATSSVARAEGLWTSGQGQAATLPRCLRARTSLPLILRSTH
jgi:hypothetical protein